MRSQKFDSRLYLNMVLTVIAALLVWNTLTRTVTVAHAQPSHWKYTTVVLANSNWVDGGVATFEKNLNDAAKGGELVALVPQAEPQFVAVFKHQ